MQVNQLNLTMEVDTGALVSSGASAKSPTSNWKENHPKLNKTKVKLRTYSGEILKVIGSITETASACGRWQQSYSIVGKNWLLKIRLNWTELLHKVEKDNCALEDVLQNTQKSSRKDLGW